MHWLAEHVDLGAAGTAPDVARRLTETGTELERLLHHGVATPETVVVGRVLACEQHPDADRLKVCRVATGEGDVAKIVCGAPNVAEGQVVAVALVGTDMGGGLVIRKAKLRGEVSEGMICSARELGIGEEHDGILALDEHLPDAQAIVPGTPLQDVLVHADDVLELEITPNRPDCLGVFGLAREVHAATGAALGGAPWAGGPVGTPAVGGPSLRVAPDDAAVAAAGLLPDVLDPLAADPRLAGFHVDVRTPRCLRFTARLFEDVVVAPSPLWLQARLAAAGLRPINNVVDVTNYAMLLTGQPLHAFDADRVAGGKLVVREAADGDALTTLDGRERTLRAGELVIDDADGPTSLAGAMGGARSEVHEGTTRVLLEVASWDGPAVHAVAARLGLFSEASTRLAKGLAPEQCAWAQAVASALLTDPGVAGARRVPGTIDVVDGGGAWAPAAAAPVLLREAAVERLLGTPVVPGRQREVLELLGFGVADHETDPVLAVAVPPERRSDVSREVDLIEEIARIAVTEGLEPTLPPRRRLAAARLSPAQVARRRAEDALVGRGLQEVVGWSFTDAGAPARLGLTPEDPRAAGVVLEDPMSEEQAVLRPSILISLLDVARANRARGAQGLRIFESGRVYRDQPAPDGSQPHLPYEHHALAVLVEDDALAAKGLLQAVLTAVRAPDAELVPVTDVAFLHPGRGAAVQVAGERVGLLGEVHPTVAGRWDLPRVSTVLLDLDRLIPHGRAGRPFRTVGSFPDARFDLAVVVEDDVPAARVVEVAREAAGPLLEDVRVFDAYRGDGVGEGRVSLALALRLRAPDRTLSDVDDVAPAREAVATALRERVGGVLRGG